MEENNNTNIEQKSNKGLMIVVVVLFFLAVGGGLFYLSNKPEPETIAVTNTEATATQEPSVQSGEIGTGTPSASVKEFTIDGNNFSFGPKQITVNKGDTVKLTFKDNDGMHNLVVDGYNVRTKTIKGGTQDTITFVADKSGSFKYYCSVANHEEQGMTGTLIVN